MENSMERKTKPLDLQGITVAFYSKCCTMICAILFRKCNANQCLDQLGPNKIRSAFKEGLFDREIAGEQKNSFGLLKKPLVQCRKMNMMKTESVRKKPWAAHEQIASIKRPIWAERI